MGTPNTYAPATIWDTYFADKAQSGGDLNPDGWWAPNFVPYLEQNGVATLLELGCGTGGDSLAMARRGIQVVGMDYSEVALERARAKALVANVAVEFRHHDMAQPLPFGDATFGAVMSNVAMHSFGDHITRQIIGEVRRVLQTAGLLLLHLNSTDDMPYRAAYYQRVEELELNYYREAHGQ